MSALRQRGGQVLRAVRQALRSSLARSSAIYVAASAASALISFVMLPVLTRALDPVDYGLVGTFAALVSVYSVLVGLSTHGFLSVKYFTPGRYSFASYVGACVTVLAATTAAGAAIIALFSRPLEELTGLPGRGQWLVLLAAFGQFALALSLTVSQVRQRATAYAFLQVFTAAASALGTILLVVHIGRGWDGRALAHAVSLAAVGSGALLYMLLRGALSLRVSGSQIREVLRFGVPLVPHLLASIAMTTVDRLIIASQVGLGESGYYYAAFQISTVFTLLAASVNQAWIPWLYERLAKRRRDMNRDVVRVTYVLFALFGSAALTATAAAPWLCRLLAGEAFAQAAVYLYFLIPAAALNSMYYFVGNYIFFANRTAITSVITLAVAAVQVVLTFALVTAFGASGAAAATFVAAALYFSATWYAASRCVPMPWFTLRS